ncbi:MAG: transcriptional coactivator p15/PC4 family protein [Thermodesulfobacteriota bacterium]
MSDNRTLIYAFTKNRRGEEIQIALQWFRGRQYVDVRQYFPDRLTGEMRPCQKGVAVDVGHLDELIDGLIEARALMEAEAHTAMEVDPHAPTQ